jgi:hypothetical protein
LQLALSQEISNRKTLEGELEKLRKIAFENEKDSREMRA